VTAIVSIVVLIVIGGVVAVVARVWRRHEAGSDAAGAELIPYLLLAIAVGTAGFTLAALARASLVADQVVGRPIGEIAGSLAGLVVSGPIAFFLWRRQAQRRRAHPVAAGWPIYLAIIELVFLSAFFLAVRDLAADLTGIASGADWTDLVVYGGIVALHWWAQRRERPQGGVGELPRLVGSGVALIALAVGLIGTLAWLLSLAYDRLWGLGVVPELQSTVGLLVTGAPIWAYRWLPAWEDEPAPLRSFYLGLSTTVFLTLSIGALVTLIAALLGFLAGDPGPAGDHFEHTPAALAALLGGAVLWWHHSRKLGQGRSAARRGHEYAMAAIGLAALVGSTAALVDATFTPTLAGTDRAGTLLTLGCVVIASGWVWLAFWRRVQAASPRDEEARSLPRRFYLIGMSIALGITAAGSLIAVLVIVFRALLGEGQITASDLRIPVTLTVAAGLATWHLIDHIRSDRAGLERVEVKPYTVTVICSDPGNLATLFPREATLRFIYRGDGAGAIDDDTASAIVSAVDGTPSLVWVDDDGFRTAPARQP
jgi:hypothetical protein